VDEEIAVSLGVYPKRRCVNIGVRGSAVMTAGAAALGRRVNIFLQYWALDAFRKDRIGPDAGSAQKPASPRRRAWSRPPRRPPGALARGRSARRRDLGDVDIQACSLSMDVLKIEEGDLDPLVDGSRA